jgi:phage shock protein PspC (stress-responsive transcriptional regulator)
MLNLKKETVRLIKAVFVIGGISAIIYLIFIIAMENIIR